MKDPLEPIHLPTNLLAKRNGLCFLDGGDSDSSLPVGRGFSDPFLGIVDPSENPGVVLYKMFVSDKTHDCTD